MLKALIGKLSNPHEVFPYLFEPFSQQLIILVMFIFILIAILVTIISVTYLKKWRYLWNEWIVTSRS